MKCELSEILTFELPSVVRRYQKENPQKADKAETLFKDLLRFFWCSKKHHIEKSSHPEDPALDFVFIMDGEMRDIDQMWHAFLLYTSDYMKFCDRYFGEYLHHQPDLVPQFEKYQFDFETNLEKFLDYIYENLGEDTMRRWFTPSLLEAKAREASA